jgi:phosphatidylinositol kinase/protein kinase (PI-3  family)
MNRDKYPEKVPFRLTRMLVKAMEVSGIEGSYRSTCERTMTVLRNSRDSLVAMLEAFVYDPLISWRLAGLSSGSERPGMPEGTGDNTPGQGLRALGVGVNEVEGVPIDLAGRSVLHESISEAHNEDEDDDDHVPRAGGTFPTPLSFREAIGGSQSTRGRRDVVVSASRARSLQMYSNIQALAANVNSESRIASITGERSEQIAVEGSIARSRIERSMRQREVMSLLQGEDGAAHEEALNEKALKVIRRVREKLTGTDFPDYHASKEPLDVSDQVQRLIVEATSCENLCQLFIGWYVCFACFVQEGMMCLAHA